jgi:hypothetical protein
MMMRDTGPAPSVTPRHLRSVIASQISPKSETIGFLSAYFLMACQKYRKGMGCP